MTYSDRLIVDLLFVSTTKESERIKIIKSTLGFALFISLILLGIVPTTVSAQRVTNNTTSDSTDFGGLSTESIDISKVDRSDLIRNATGNNPIFGGLSTKSADITT